MELKQKSIDGHCQGSTDTNYIITWQMNLTLGRFLMMHKKETMYWRILETITTILTGKKTQKNIEGKQGIVVAVCDVYMQLGIIFIIIIISKLGVVFCRLLSHFGLRLYTIQW